VPANLVVHLVAKHTANLASAKQASEGKVLDCDSMSFDSLWFSYLTMSAREFSLKGISAPDTFVPYTVVG
jgi:hypothetical protein